MLLTTAYDPFSVLLNLVWALFYVKLVHADVVGEGVILEGRLCSCFDAYFER